MLAVRRRRTISRRRSRNPSDANSRLKAAVHDEAKVVVVARHRKRQRLVREEAVEDEQVARGQAALHGLEQDRAVAEEDVGATVEQRGRCRSRSSSTGTILGMSCNSFRRSVSALSPRVPATTENVLLSQELVGVRTPGRTGRRRAVRTECP